MSTSVFGDGDDLGSKATVLLIGIGSAALVVTIYHCLAMGCRNRHQQQAAADSQHNNSREMASSFENSAAQLIPAFKYQKGMKMMIGGGGDGGCDGEEISTTCAICLSEFEEGEELRTLPECMHSYHLACIDMWLYSHPNCPVCRADAVTPSALWPTTVEVGSLESNTYQDLGMLQNIVIQSRTI